MMSQPGTYDLSIWRGDTFSRTLTFTDGDSNPIDFTGVAWVAQIRTAPDATETEAAFTVDTTDAATGVLVVTLSAAQTADLGPSGYWDLQGTAADSTVRTYLFGTVTVNADVTR